MPEDETHIDPETGEVVDRMFDIRAADGGRAPHAATTAGEFINMIEDGQFAADLNRELAALAEKMNDMVEATGNKQKAKVTITIDFASEGGPFIIAGAYKITPPAEKRKRTLVWTDEHNRFTRSQPRQGQFFGVRVVDAQPTRKL